MSDRRELQNTVKFYQRHIFVNTGDRPWHSRVEDSDEVIARLVQALGRSPRMLPATRVTAYRTSQENDGDVLVFPDCLRYRPSKKQSEDRIIQALAGGDSVGQLESERLDGLFFFVCVHGERDRRCGQCGPPLIDALEDYLAEQNFSKKSHVYPCSHVGGHRYAGNLLVYPGGYWYGYVTPRVVGDIVNCTQENKVFSPLFRGHMSPS